MEIIKALQKLKENFDSPADLCSEVEGLLKWIASLEFALLITFWLKVLQAINKASAMVQSSTVTLDEASKLLDSLLNNIKHLRENWPHLLQESREVAANLGFETEFTRKRQKRRKKHPIVSQKEYYQVNAFYVAMDAIIGLVLQQFRPSQAGFHSFGMHMSVMTNYTPNLLNYQGDILMI